MSPIMGYNMYEKIQMQNHIPINYNQNIPQNPITNQINLQLPNLFNNIDIQNTNDEKLIPRRLKFTDATLNKLDLTNKKKVYNIHLNY